MEQIVVGKIPRIYSKGCEVTFFPGLRFEGVSGPAFGTDSYMSDTERSSCPLLPLASALAPGGRSWADGAGISPSDVEASGGRPFTRPARQL
jgi:hypothetical protein